MKRKRYIPLALFAATWIAATYLALAAIPAQPDNIPLDNALPSTVAPTHADTPESAYQFNGTLLIEDTPVPLHGQITTLPAQASASLAGNAASILFPVGALLLVAACSAALFYPHRPHPGSFHSPMPLATAENNETGT